MRTPLALAIVAWHTERQPIHDESGKRTPISPDRFWQLRHNGYADKAETTMPIFELNKKADDSLNPRSLDETSFNDERISEKDLQKMLRSNIGMIVENPDVMVIAEEFSNWQDASRRIDLLGIDQDANLIVVELKKTGDGAHMELQALRYAAMVSTMTFEHAVEA